MKTPDNGFKAGQKVWVWNHAQLERRTVERKFDGNDEAYRLVKTTAYSRDTTIGAYLFAYPQDRKALIAEMEDDSYSINYKLAELRAGKAGA